MTSQDNFELVSEPTTSIPSSDATSTLLTVESAIKTRMSQIERKKGEIKTLRETIISYLENDETYLEREQLAKEAAKQKLKTKKDLLLKLEIRQTVEKMKGLQEELKETKEAFSYYLTQYQQMTGQNQFEGDDGEVQDIVYIAKLIKRSVFEK